MQPIKQKSRNLGEISIASEPKGSVTLGHLISIKDSLTKIYNYDIPMEEAQKAGRTLVEIEQEFEIYENNRKRLFEKYGELDKKGEQLVIPPKNTTEFNRELQELLACEVNINIATIKIGSLDGIKLSVLDMKGLDRFIEKEEDIVEQDEEEVEEEKE